MALPDSDLNFISVWGGSEKAYSGVVAQTLALSPAVRSFFLLKLATHLRGLESAHASGRLPANGAHSLLSNHAM